MPVGEPGRADGTEKGQNDIGTLGSWKEGVHSEDRTPGEMPLGVEERLHRCEGQFKSDA